MQGSRGWSVEADMGGPGVGVWEVGRGGVAVHGVAAATDGEVEAGHAVRHLCFGVAYRVCCCIIGTAVFTQRGSKWACYLDSVTW